MILRYNFPWRGAIQQSVYQANKSLPAATRMSFRIGSNVGDVIVRDGDIYGDGVNIELAFWHPVKDSDDPATFEAYLQKFPEGEFGQLAEIQITKLRSVVTNP